jgi:DNA-binding transcriptional LysR family regulator
LFCDVAGHRSFSQAARKHGITQSAASQRVGQLEKRLGVTLLDRSVRPLSLTAAGELFVREVRELLDRYDRLEHRLAAFESQLSGEVAVIAIYSAGIDLLNEARAAFETRHPRVRVNVAYAHHERIYEAVRGGRADLGILSFPAHSRDLTVVPLRDEQMVVVTRGGHALARRYGTGSIEAGELGGEPAGVAMAAFEPALPVARHIRRYFKDQGVSPRIASTFDNVDTIKSAVEVTDHVALLPRRTVLREVAAGTLAAIDLHPPLARPMGIIRRRGNGSGGLSRAAQALIDFLLQHTGSHGDMVAAAASAAESISVETVGEAR